MSLVPLVQVEFLVTSIEVMEGKKVDGDEFGPDALHVEFSGSILEEKDDRDMVYLVNVVEIKGGKHTNYHHEKIKFSAIQVSAEIFVGRLAAKGKKVLACLHGFQGEPLSWINTCNKIQDHSDFDHLVLPVIWPSVGRPYWSYTFPEYYGKEQRIARTAGKAFNAITAFGTGEISLSLMSHSMGNRVLLSFAESQSTDPAKKFDHIFMVAADVWEEVFNDRVITGKSPGNAKWGDAGLKLCRMVHSKIHIVHYEDDNVLWLSSAQNGGILGSTHTRLGRFGKKAQNDRGRLNDECEPILVDKDMKPHSTEIKKVDSDAHSYQTCGTIVKYYNDQMNK